MNKIPSNPNDVTPFDVLEYQLDRVTDPNRRLAIEQSRETHPHLWEAYEDVEVTDEHIGPDETAEGIPDAVDDYFKKRAESRRVEAPITEYVAAAVAETRPLLKAWNPEVRGGRKAVWSPQSVANCADGEPFTPPYVTTVGLKVRAAFPEAMVPYGIVRAFAADTDGVPLATKLFTMDLESDNVWRREFSLKSLFGTGVPGKDLSIYIQPARRELFAWFAEKDVRELATRVKDDPVKFSRLEKLCVDLKGWTNDRK